MRFDERIAADSTIALFKQIEQNHFPAGIIFVICDNAGYYRSRAVQEYLDRSPIELVFLPPYAPNPSVSGSISLAVLWKQRMLRQDSEVVCKGMALAPET